MSYPFTSPTLRDRIAPLRRRQWRASRQAAEASAELRDVFHEIEAAVRCTRCRARVGEQCRTESGRPLAEPHTERIRAYDHHEP